MNASVCLDRHVHKHSFLLFVCNCGLFSLMLLTSVNKPSPSHSLRTNTRMSLADLALHLIYVALKVKIKDPL